MSKELKIKSLWDEHWVRGTFKHPTKKCEYEFSNYGRVKSVNKITGKENLLKGSLSHLGMRQINIRLADNKHGSMFPHRLVAENFVRKPSPDCEYIWHKDEDKLNNHFENLEWLTKEEWMSRLMERGSYSPTHASRYKTYKLNETKVRQIKRSLKAGKKTKTSLAQKFGVSITQINRIASGENWGHITLDK